MAAIFCFRSSSSAFFSACGGSCKLFSISLSSQHIDKLILQKTILTTSCPTPTALVKIQPRGVSFVPLS